MMEGMMEVTVVGARDLKNTQLFGRIKPYVVIRYQNQEQKSTTGQPKTASLSRLKCCCICRCRQGQGGRRAVWNEKFKFKVDYYRDREEDDKQQQHKLLLKIMDHDSFTTDDCIGQATIYVNDLLEVGMEKGKAQLPTQKYRIVSTNNTYQGEIQVGITFTLTGENSQQALVDDGRKPKTS